MTATEFFETYLNSGQINEDTIVRMNTDKDEIVWLMEDYAKYIQEMIQSNIIGDSMDLELLNFNPDEQ